MPRGKYKRVQRPKMAAALSKIRARNAEAEASQLALKDAYNRGYDAAMANARNGASAPSAPPPHSRDRHEAAARTINSLNRLADRLSETSSALLQSLQHMNGEI